MPRARCLWTLAAVAACGRADFTPRADDAPAPPADALICNPPAQLSYPSEGTAHSDGGVPPIWATNPPTSGLHFDRWARWNRAYAEVIPRGYWVHNLEHGGVVFGYRCPDGCAAEVARLTAMLATLPADADCPALGHRAIVVPDPDLPANVRFAAAAWQNSWTANCVDEASLVTFYKTKLSMAPEVNCQDGDYP